jgi:hypothetical protein
MYFRFFLFFILKTSTLLVVFCSISHAAQSVEKTPDDVFMEAVLLAENIKYIRKQAGIETPWPSVSLQEGHNPQHVMQKATEILDKINRYRKNVAKSGEIAVSRFLGRDITPNEVFLSVSHLRREISLLIEDSAKFRINRKKINPPKGKTPSHVYAKLSEISIALDESLGLRGITPSEVFIRSQQVLDLARFLRQSQNLRIPAKLITDSGFS